MSLRLEHLQVARLAPRALGDSVDLVIRFLRERLTSRGGFADRAGQADLYYTVFGLDSLVALRAELPAPEVRRYLESHGDGTELDLIHRASLVRAWAALAPAAAPGSLRRALAASFESLRTGEGGYSLDPGREPASIYGTFLITGALEDLGCRPGDVPDMVRFLRSCQRGGGGFADRRSGDAEPVMTTVTAAAVALLAHLGEDPGPGARAWLLDRLHPQGGFVAAPGACAPDLLSTAVALAALGSGGALPRRDREACLDFLDSLWTNRGSFHADWTETALDTEFTYYGLLALGHLVAQEA